MPSGTALCLRRKPEHNVRTSRRTANCASPSYKLHETQEIKTKLEII